MAACLLALAMGCDEPGSVRIRSQGGRAPVDASGSIDVFASPATGSATGSPVPSASPSSGSVGVTPTPIATDSAATQSTPVPDPTPTPLRTLPPEPVITPSPTPTPTPTPTPQPTAFPTSVKVAPKTGELNAKAPTGTNLPGFVSTMKLSVVVTLSDAATTSVVDWTSSDPLRVTVGSDGTVTALASASPGDVTITATAKGSSLSDKATITITTKGRLDVTVE
ncbi:MAG: Ig-like domain-containing protein [Candidatus Sericytochromatia bacterium]|nr:Ig-like domain-containing protein [Candidatus Tanganyikabacteria bacterium]